MPVKIRKKPSGKYTVKTPGGTKAKDSTKENAEGQARLLKGIEHGWTPKAVVQPKKKVEPKKPRSRKHNLRKKV